MPTADNAVAEIRNSFRGQPYAPSVETTYQYTSPLFNGLSIALDASSTPYTPSALSTHLRGVPHIQRLYPVRRLALLPPPTLPSARPALSATNIHATTGVAALHALGYTGANLTIAIIDTGADYLNPFLSGGLGPPCRIKYGRDFVGDSMRPPRGPVRDPDPYADCAPHGTHVAGIVGAVAPRLNLTGVAPGAALEVYRVFDCEGITETDVVVAAVLAAAARGVDVMNLSLGGGGPFEEDAISAVLSRVNRNGTTYAVASMGNDGKNGSWTSQAPGGGVDVPAVGSVAAMELKTPGWVANWTVGANETENRFLWLPADRSVFPLVLQLWVLSANTSVEDDACKPLPPATPDLSGRLVLTFNGTRASAGIGANDGLALVSAYFTGRPVYVTMNTTEYPTSAWVVPNRQTGGRMSTFSSIGPPALGYMKPTISAPGEMILSTVPRKDGFFDNFSGTSMAAPYISGVVALLKQARPGLTFQQITTLLSTTGKPMPFNDGTNRTYPFLAPAWQQGGGLVSAFDAFQCQTMLDTEALAFNDTAHFEPELSFTVRNLGNAPSSYQLSNIPAATILSYRGDGNPNPIKFFPNESWPLPNPDFTYSLTPDFASISVSPHAFTLGPGGSQTVSVSADISALAHLTPTCPLFSGYIAINSTRDRLTLPWGAIGCSLSSLPVLDPHEPLIHLVAATNETEYNASLRSTYPLPRIEPDRVFVLPRSNASDARLNVTFPWLQYKFAQYSRFARVDVLGANGSRVATVLDQNTTADSERLPRDEVVWGSEWDGGLEGLGGV
ncbi:hypothetical protein SLS56_011289 [Neofusicoccum ribis]|uniref:Uncharacterized protein n=1 Tax=Neofusicoccum ribis TaxID=45134 RepID=A0ABR3SC10_9PEZI